MNSLLFYYIWTASRRHEDENEENDSDDGFYVDWCTWTKFDDWLYKHKVLWVVYPYLVGLLIGAAPFILSWLFTKLAAG